MPNLHTKIKSNLSQKSTYHKVKTLKLTDISFIFSVLIILIGLSSLIGWWTKSILLVSLMPEWPPLYFNTAILVILSGIALFLYGQEENKKIKVAIAFLGTLIIFFSALIASQDILGVNLGIDELFSQDWLTKSDNPGRIPLNTAIAFMISGLILILLVTTQNIYTVILSQILSAILFFIGFLGVTGYFVDTQILYNWGHFKPMSLHASLAIILLDVGLWLIWRNKEWNQQLYKDKEDLRIIIIAFLIAISILAFTIIYEFSILIDNGKKNAILMLDDEKTDVQREMTKDLQEIHESVQSFNQDLFTQNFSNVDLHAITDIIKFHLHSPQTSAIKWIDENNKILFVLNELTENPSIVIPLQNQSELLWKNQLIYRQTIPVRVGFKAQGYIIAEWILKEFHTEFTDYKRLGTTGEYLICQEKSKQQALCLPSRFNPTPFLMNLKNNPMSYALQGSEGNMEFIDYQGNLVITSYGPLSNLPLGLVVKSNTNEIYSTVKNVIMKFIYSIFLFILIGMIILYWQIHPLVRRVIESRKQAIMANKNLDIINQKLTRNLRSLIELQGEANKMAEINTFLEVSNTIEEAANICTTYCLKLFPNSSGTLYLLSSDKTQLQSISTWNTPLNNSKNLIPDGCWGIRKGELHLASPPNFEIICDHIHKELNETIHYYCQPLKVHGSIIGLLYLELPALPDPNKKALLNLHRLITHFSDTIALFLSNIRLREELQLQAIHDHLTGLFNRRHLDDAFHRYLEIAKRKKLTLATFMIDIDNFKDFNDQFGHEAGDLILQRVGAFLQKSVREYNIACRFGGEEFLIVFLDISKENALERAESIRTGIEAMQLIHHDRILPKVTVSIGISIFPDNGQDVKSLIENADIALYQAKKEGRNKVVLVTTGSHNT